MILYDTSEKLLKVTTLSECHAIKVMDKSWGRSGNSWF